MMTFTDLPSAPGPLAPCTDRLRLALAAYLARFTGSSRAHTGSGLRCYLAWCAEQGLDPLAVQPPYMGLYIRWMQEVRRFAGRARVRPVHAVLLLPLPASAGSLRVDAGM
jgi:hypothetical protein